MQKLYKDMRYFIRSVKYFFYFAILTTLIILALIATGLADSDIDLLFKDGISTIWKMAAFFVIVGAIYPKVGFISRKISTERSLSEIKGEIITFMKDRQYEMGMSDQSQITFRRRGALSRLTRMYEDRITLTETEGGLEMEGLRKDVFHIATSLEYRLNPQQES